MRTLARAALVCASAAVLGATIVAGTANATPGTGVSHKLISQKTVNGKKYVINELTIPTTSFDSEPGRRHAVSGLQRDFGLRGAYSGSAVYYQPPAECIGSVCESDQLGFAGRGGAVDIAADAGVSGVDGGVVDARLGRTRWPVTPRADCEPEPCSSTVCACARVVRLRRSSRQGEPASLWRLGGCCVVGSWSSGADNNADNNVDCAGQTRTTSAVDNDKVRAGELGGFGSSHRRGHWFDPSIAHHAKAL
jgi:hypothetical protein